MAITGDNQMTPDQFTEAHQDHAAKLRSYLLRLRIRPEAVPDLCQDAWVKAWEHRETITPASMGAWLRTAARNLYIDQYRTRAHRNTGQLPEHYDKPAPASSPTRVLQAKQALLVSDPILIDAYVFGLTMAEIADSWGIPVPTAKTRIARSKEKARLALR